MAYRNRKAYGKTAKMGIPKAQSNIPSEEMLNVPVEETRGWPYSDQWSSGDKFGDHSNSLLNPRKGCMDRFKDRILLGSRKYKFKNKSLESARKTKKYNGKFSGLVGYSFNDEDNDESSDEDNEDDEFISNNI